MKNKQNLHIHTTYADGKNTPKEIITFAIERGFDSIGFSEHTYMSFSDYPYQMKIEDMPRYKNYIDCYYREAEELLSFVGFKSKWILTDSGFTEVGI